MDFLKKVETPPPAKKRQRAPSLTRPGQVRKLLQRTVFEVRQGTITPAIANSIGFLCNCLLKSLEQTEIERRLDEIEKRVGGSTSTLRRVK